MGGHLGAKLGVGTQVADKWGAEGVNSLWGNDLGVSVGAAFPYPLPSREANPNIPPPNEQPTRNDNDPNPCPTGP
jgi:hypothetical protein